MAYSKGLRGEFPGKVVIGAKGDKGDPFVYEDFTPEQLENLRGPHGVSGVYVGSGEMPEGYNVQVDPEGNATDFGEEYAGSLLYVTADGELAVLPRADFIAEILAEIPFAEGVSV